MLVSWLLVVLLVLMAVCREGARERAYLIREVGWGGGGEERGVMACQNK